MKDQITLNERSINITGKQMFVHNFKSQSSENVLRTTAVVPHLKMKGQLSTGTILKTNINENIKMQR